MKMATFLLFFSLAFTLDSSKASTITCPTDRNDYFCITPEMAPESEVAVYDFITIPQSIKYLYQSELNGLGFPLMLDLQWHSPYFGAGVSFYEERFRMMVLGGTTRVKGFSKDAYAAVICHELGHLIGGEPFQKIKGSEWASAEGQSDFFAASECLPKYFAVMGEPADLIPARVEKAGFEMFNAFKDISKGPHTRPSDNELVRHQKDESVVSETLYNRYPTLQCRYENFRDYSQRPTCWYHP